IASRLAWMRDRVKTPYLRACVRIERDEKAAHGIDREAVAHPLIDFPFCSKRASRGVNAAGCRRNLPFPDELAGAHVKRGYTPVRRHKDLVVVDGEIAHQTIRPRTGVLPK